ncbi:hypothetical protein ACLOJK_009776 [Asimina triloba]
MQPHPNVRVERSGSYTCGPACHAAMTSQPSKVAERIRPSIYHGPTLTVGILKGSAVKIINRGKIKRIAPTTQRNKLLYDAVYGRESFVNFLGRIEDGYESASGADHALYSEHCNFPHCPNAATRMQSLLHLESNKIWKNSIQKRIRGKLETYIGRDEWGNAVRNFRETIRFNQPFFHVNSDGKKKKEKKERVSVSHERRQKSDVNPRHSQRDMTRNGGLKRNCR